MRIPGIFQFSTSENALLIEVAGICAFIWVVANLILGMAEPVWYDRLNKNATRRTFLVGAMIGLSFKFFTIPSCMLAAYMTSPENDIAGIHPPMNVWQQTCWGSRGMVTFLELMHFASNRELVFHHTLLLLAMSIIAIYNGPHRGFDLSLGALVSEIPNSIFMVCKDLDILYEYPRLDWILPLSTAILAFAFRVPAVVIAMAMIPTTSLRGGPAAVLWVAHFFYLAYIFNITWRRLKRAGVWQRSDEGTFQLRLSNQIVISAASFCTGLTATSAQITALSLYSAATTNTTPKLIHLCWVSLPTTLFLTYAVVVSYRGIYMVHVQSFITSTCSRLNVILTIPSSTTITRWLVRAWISYVALLIAIGDTPEAHNKDLTPEDLASPQPPLCGLILSWQLWVCTTSTWIVSTMIAHCFSNPIAVQIKKVGFCYSAEELSRS